MISFGPIGLDAQPLEILCLGAHCDDIEIGCGGTLQRLLLEHPESSVSWFVLASNSERAAEADACAKAFLRDAGASRVVIRDFRESYFPWEGAAIKDFFEEIKAEVSPDLVFTHYREDRHQDHRIVSDLTWNTFREPDHNYPAYSRYCRRNPH